MRRGIIFIALLLNVPTQCGNSAFLPGTRTNIVAECLSRKEQNNRNETNDIISIIAEYDIAPSLEAHSKRYYAYVQNAHQRNGKVVLCDRSGTTLRSFSASYIRAIVLPPQEDMVIVMHEKSEGRLYGISYQSLTRNLFWRSLALTGFSIETGRSHTFWPSWFYVNIPPACIKNKKSGLAQNEILTVTLYDRIPVLNHVIKPAMYTYPFTLTVPCHLEKMRRRLQQQHQHLQ